MAMTACAAKFLHQFDLLIGEGAHLLAVDAHSANQLVLLEHRHDQKRPGARELGDRFIGAFRREVGNVDHLLRPHESIEAWGIGAPHQCRSFTEFRKFVRRIVECNATERIAVTQQHRAEHGLANPRRVCQHRLEHRLQLAGRARNDLENLRGRGLLLQRLGESLPGLSEFAGPNFQLRFQLGGQ